MGGFISTIRDLKVILRDLKITLKFSAKIILKVHGIVDDVENTVQELKTTVANLSTRVPAQTTSQEKLMEEKASMYLCEVVQCIETTADSVKSSLANAIGVLTSDDLLKNTSDAFDNLVNHSGKNLSGVMAKWASIPDGIGDLVRQDCITLKDYAQSSNVMALEAKTSEKTDEKESSCTTLPCAKVNEVESKDDNSDTGSAKSLKTKTRRLDENQLTCTTLSAKMEKFETKDDISAKRNWKDFELIDIAQTLPRRLVDDISFLKYGGTEIVNIFKPLTNSYQILGGTKWHEIEILPSQADRKCLPEQQENKCIVKSHDAIQTNFFSGKDFCPEPLTEFQREILSLLLMTLLQGISSDDSVSRKAITILSSSPKCKSIGETLMAEYLPCD